MAFNFPIFSLVFLVCGLLAVIFAGVVWMKRPSPGAVPFSLLMLAVAEWIFGLALEAGAVDISVKIFWGKVEYFGIAGVGALWLLFASDYAGLSWWRRPRNLALLMFLPVVSLVMVWTNQRHGWVWPSISLSPGTSGTILVWQHGWWFWTLLAFQYATIVSGILILWRFAFRRPGLRLKQVVALLIGTLVPVIGNMVYLLRLTPLIDMNSIPLIFLGAGIIYALSIFRFRLLDVVPLARGALVENLPDGILVLDSEQRLADMNHSVETIIGLGLKECRGQPLKTIGLPWSKMLESDVDNKEGAQKFLEYSVGQRHFEINVTSFSNNNAVPLGKLVVIRDVSERKIIQKKIESLYEEELQLRSSLQEEIDKRSKYTRSLVHELKTPLTAILASSELLEEEVHDKVLSALVQNIRRASSNLEQRINELVELARGEIGLLHIDPQPVDMAKLVAEIVSEMSPVAENKSLKLSYVAGETLPQVAGDKSRLKQVLTNLVGNAVKFTPKGSITIKTSLYDKAVLVQVTDTGRGIEDKEMQQLFDPYRPRDFDRNRLGGLGIGLALSKIIVDLHHGKIWAESKQGEGATFSFTIPVVDGALLPGPANRRPL
jgi:PAS domain S-box-containing protein